jgi:uncharacterized protein YjhX (UPF0386 family)
MARPKFDGVIEAVRYAPNGRIILARLYERRGAVWTDHLLLDRKQLTERLKRGRRFVTGQRKPYRGGTFVTGNPVRLEGQNIVSNGASAMRDELTGVPVF